MCTLTAVKFREKGGAAIVVTQLEVWFKGYTHPVKNDVFEQMFSNIRSTIRNQVWEKAGVYLNEDIIVPLCDTWASTVHHLTKVIDEHSEEYSRLLAKAQNILSENFITPHKVACDNEVMVQELKEFSRYTGMEMYVNNNHFLDMIE